MKKLIVILLILVAVCSLVNCSQLSKKEEKSLVSKSSENLLEYVKLFKSLLTNALSKTDLASVRSLFKSPLSLSAYAVSMLLGGIALMAFYESPLSPLPIPPLPHPPVGRFPPENPIWPPNRLQRHSTGAMHFINSEQQQQLQQQQFQQHQQHQQQQTPQQVPNFILNKQIQRRYLTNQDQAKHKNLNDFAENNIKVATLNTSTSSNSKHMKKEANAKTLTNLNLKNDHHLTLNQDLLTPASSNSVTTFTHPKQLFNPQALPSSILNKMRTLPTQDKLNTIVKQKSNENLERSQNFASNTKPNLPNPVLYKETSKQPNPNGQQHLVHVQLNQVQFSNSPELSNLEKSLSQKD